MGSISDDVARSVRELREMAGTDRQRGLMADHGSAERVKLLSMCERLDWMARSIADGCCTVALDLLTSSGMRFSAVCNGAGVVEACTSGYSGVRLGSRLVLAEYASITDERVCTRVMLRGVVSQVNEVSILDPRGAFVWAWRGDDDSPTRGPFESLDDMILDASGRYGEPALPPTCPHCEQYIDTPTARAARWWVDDPCTCTA